MLMTAPMRTAGDDKRVKGVLARLGSREGLGGMAMAQVGAVIPHMMEIMWFLAFF